MYVIASDPPNLASALLHFPLAEKVDTRRASPEIPLPHCAQPSPGSMTQRKKPPFAPTTRSLLRLRNARCARQGRRGEISATSSRRPGQHIRKRRKTGVGRVQAVTDGEFRRDWWHIDFLAGFDGVTLSTGTPTATRNSKAREQPPSC